MRTPLIIAVLGAGLLAGCSSPSTPSSPSSAEPADKAVAYSQCMRENGVPSFPDPVDGRIQLQGGPGSDLDPSSESFKKAEQTCKDLAPAGSGNGGQDTAQQSQILKWVACMRQNGVPTMPDPQADGKMLVGPDSGVDPQSQAYKDAETKCRDLAPGGLG
jgi:hypothetical protein